MWKLIYDILKDKGFWESLTASFLGTGTALIIFFLETKREKKKTTVEKRENYNNALVYFKLLIENILVNTKKQVDAYELHSLAIKETPFKLNLLKKYVTNDVDRLLNKFDQERLFQAFTQAFGNQTIVIKEFKNIYSTLDYIDSVTDQVSKLQENYLIQQHDSFILYKDCSEEQVLSNCVKIIENIRQTNDEFQGNEMYVRLNDIVYNYYDTSPEPPTLEHIQNNLVIPLRNIIVEKFRNNPEALALAEACRKATWIYNDILFKANHTSDEFHNIYQDTTSVLEKLRGYDRIYNIDE